MVGPTRGATSDDAYLETEYMIPDGQPISWRKSSASVSGNCVEVGAAGGRILVRDTKDRAGSVLSFTSAEWRAFLTGVTSGEFSVELLRNS